MKIQTTAWHYRLLVWLFDNVDDVPRSLCPYVDWLLLAIVVSPFLWAKRSLWGVLSEDGRFVALIVASELIMWAIIGVSLHSIVTALLLVLGANALALIVFIGIVKIADVTEGKHWHFPRLRHGPKEEKPPEAPRKPREPSLLGEWLRAKHRKICPLLEFERPIHAYYYADPREN